MDSFIKHWDYQSVNPFYVQNDMIEKAYGISGLFQTIETRTPELNDCKITTEQQARENDVFCKISYLQRPDNMIFNI